MIEIKNRLPTKPNRWKITHESDSSQEYITWDYADEPTEAGTPINRALVVGMYNDMTPAGIVKTFCNKATREGYLLCDGSSVMGADYPDLIGKLKSYDLYQYKEIEDITGYATTSEGGIKVANGKFFMLSSYESSSNYAKLWVSDNGETWTQIATDYSFSGNGDTLIDVLYVNGTYNIFAQCGGYPSVFYGSDLNSLTRKRIVSSTSRSFSSVGNIGNTLVVAINVPTSSPGDTYIYYGSGDTWTQALTFNYTKYPIIKTVDNKIYFGINLGTSDIRLYSSSDGATWTYDTVANDSDLPKAYDCYYSGYIWRMSGTTLQQTQDYDTWETIETYSTDVTGTSFYIDERGNAFLSRRGSTYANVPSLYSTDLSTFEPLGTEYVTNNYISTDIVSNGATALCTAEGYILRYDITIDNPKLVLPTLNDDTNQLYGYIKTEVE